MKRLALALEQARSTRSRLAKESALAAALSAIAREPGDEDGVGLATAARLVVGRTLPVGDGRSLGVGGSLLMEIAERQTGYSRAVLWACARRTGDFGEALGLLAERDASARARAGVPLRELAGIFERLASVSHRARKFTILEGLLARSAPLEIKYIVKVILGSLRTGALGGVMEGAIARAFELPVEEVRRAGALVTDPGELAILARDGRTAEARLRVGRPVAYMLATPMETLAQPIDPALYVVEDKLDGVRTQVHKHGSDVAVFARGLDPVTSAFPEVVEAFRFVPGSVALDGELIATHPSGRPRPFQALQARLRRVAPTRAMIEETRVVFVAFDLLSDGHEDLLGLPWSERRKRLEAFAAERGPRDAFALNPYRRVVSRDAEPLAALLDREFEDVRRRGHEGLVLKRADAAYEAGRRGQSWIKVKRALATLDVVITAAEEGHGRRAGVLSDYTFAVWRGDDLVNVGKAYSGLTDVEIDAMNRRLRASTTERRGGVRLVRPEIVLEIAFDGIQRSARHKSGFALRFPRIVRVRDDKRPADADRLTQVEALFAAQVESGHREEQAEPPEEEGARPELAAKSTAKKSAKTGRKAKKGDASRQLSLFERDEGRGDGGENGRDR